MLDFNQFGTDAVPVLPGAVIGDGVRVVFDPDASMLLTARRAERDLPGRRTTPTLVLRGENRAPDDWLGVEIDLPSPAHDVALTARNYPVHRLFPRLHYDHPGGTGHVDLPDVAASDTFATRIFDARTWSDAHRIASARALRLTVLIPSTPWFAMEIESIKLHTVAHA
ncbi:MAG: hypothetical protein AAGH68_16755 [Pseudomonadota bacterium]